MVAGTTQRPLRSALLNSAATGWLALGRGRSRGQPGELAQGPRGQRGRHPLAVLLMGDAAVGERLAEHGHHSFTVGVGGAKIARRWARGHELKIPCFSRSPPGA
jgi:hypothetical protein